MRIVVCIVALMCVSTAALAANPTPLDFTQVLIGINGKPITQPSPDCKSSEVGGKDCPLVDVTLSDVAIGALEASLDEDRTADIKKKFARGMLAQDIYRKKQIVLSPDDVSLIKDRIGKSYSTAVVVAAWPLLDPTLTTDNK